MSPRSLPNTPQSHRLRWRSTATTIEYKTSTNIRENQTWSEKPTTSLQHFLKKVGDMLNTYGPVASEVDPSVVDEATFVVGVKVVVGEGTLDAAVDGIAGFEGVERSSLTVVPVLVPSVVASAVLIKGLAVVGVEGTLGPVVDGLAGFEGVEGSFLTVAPEVVPTVVASAMLVVGLAVVVVEGTLGPAVDGLTVFEGVEGSLLTVLSELAPTEATSAVMIAGASEIGEERTLAAVVDCLADFEVVEGSCLAVVGFTVVVREDGDVDFVVVGETETKCSHLFNLTQL